MPIDDLSPLVYRNSAYSLRMLALINALRVRHIVAGSSVLSFRHGQ